MKLIDLLVKELPKSGGWPSGAKSCVQSAIDNEIYFYNKTYNGSGSMIAHRGKFYFPTADETGVDNEGLLMGSVSREQYESALAAQSVWNGEGLPPVGCECELFDCENWNPVIIKFLGEKYVVTERTDLGYEVVYCVAERPELFRPIRTEEKRKRDEFAKLLCDHLYNLTEWESPVGKVHALAIYDAIASGKIAGVKLD